MGGTLTVQAWMDGKPVAGVKVCQDAVTDPGGVHAWTDQQGMARLQVRNAGPNSRQPAVTDNRQSRTRIHGRRRPDATWQQKDCPGRLAWSKGGVLVRSGATPLRCGMSICIGAAMASKQSSAAPALPAPHGVVYFATSDPDDFGAWLLPSR
jgi:hypothetical protein